MISQFFVLSQRGDNIVFRDYRGDVQKGSAEIFFRKVKFWKEDGEGDAPPVFNVDGVNYFHVKVAGLLFAATTRVNVSPSLVFELLQRIARVIKDYLGVLNEDSLRKNFVLVYELLDEVIDFGYVQTTSTEVLKSYVFNEPIVVDATRLPTLDPASLFMQGTKRMPGTAVTKSVVANEPGGRKREEIFVDVIEKISVTFSSSGYILTSEIDGTIQMKSYLSGNPEIRLALNEDLSIGRGSGRSLYDYRGSSGSGAVILDDCNFHEAVHLDSFDIDRTLTLVPPDGEFPVMNYRMTQEFKPPFRVNALVEEVVSLKAELIIKVRAEFSSSINANAVVVQMPLPSFTSRVSFELEAGAVGQTTDFKESNKRLEWGLKKIVGGSEHTLRAKLTFSQEPHVNIVKEAGPVSMTFTIPMYNASRLQVTYLRCGGMILCTAINHCLCDGIGTSQFLHDWAHITAQSDSTPLTITPFHSRHVLKPRNPPTITRSHPSYTKIVPAAAPPPTQVAVVDLVKLLQSQPWVPTSFTFTATDILQLKKQCVPSLKCTTFEALATHTWRCWVRSLGLAASQTVKLLFSVNIRKKLNPEIPTGYYGNGFLLACAEAKVKDLVNANLRYGVKLVQQAKAVLDDECVRSIIDLLEDKSIRTDLSASLVISQWSKLGLEDVDFGQGKPLHMGSLTSDIYCLFLPVIGDLNAVRVLVSVPESVAESFEYYMIKELCDVQRNGDANGNGHMHQ